MTGEWYWHIHHGRLYERATEPVEARRKYVRANKPESEVETRLRLLRPVKSEEAIAAMEAVESARKVYHEAVAPARKTYHEAKAAANKVYNDAEESALNVYVEAVESAWKPYDKAVAATQKAINAAHRKECPNCPWNGKTIFPEGT